MQISPVGTDVRAISASFIIPKIVQRVVIDGYVFGKVMDGAQEQGQAIYDKYK